MSILDKIIFHKEFTAREFIKFPTQKKQIVLHHTVSPEGVKGDINWWLKDGKRIGTCIIVAHDGTPHQVFSSKYWAYHLGLGNKHFARQNMPYKSLDPASIGIEIDSFGGLKWDDENNCWRSVYGHRVDSNKVIEYPEGFRGFKAFERYTKAQIETVRQLILFWHTRYGIPIDYHPDMWDVSKDALKGKPGVYTHVSYRYDKSDCHPQPDLIDMLKNPTVPVC